MSSNVERIRNGLTEYVNQKMIVGEEYWVRRVDFENDFEEYCNDNNIYITWLHKEREERPFNKATSFTRELMILYPSIKHEARGYSTGLSGIGYAHMKGKTFHHFVKERLVFDDTLRVGNGDMIKEIKNFMGEEIYFEERLTLSVIFKKLYKINNRIERGMFYEGKSKRGIVGVGLKSSVSDQ